MVRRPVKRRATTRRRTASTTRTATTKRRRGTRKQNLIANAIALPIIATGSILFGTDTGRYYARRAYLRATHGYGRVGKRSYTRSRAYRGQRTRTFEE